MKKGTFLRYKFITLLTVVGLLASQIVVMGRSSRIIPANTPIETVPVAEFPPAGFASKIQGDANNFVKFVNDLIAWQNNAIALKAKSSRSESELASLRSSATNLKGRISQAKNAIQKLIENLKAGGHFGAPADTWLENQLQKKNSPILAEIKGSGGASGLLNNCAGELGSLSGDIDSLLNEVERGGVKKASNNSAPGGLIAAGFLPASAAPAGPPVAFKFRDCLLSKAAVAFCTFADLVNCREGAEKDLKKCKAAL